MIPFPRIAGFYLLWSCRWILPLSHDEVVSGKGSLLDKCGYLGTPFVDRIRTLKTLYGFQIGMPGRPLIFMGGEIGQGREWKDNRYALLFVAAVPFAVKNFGTYVCVR